MSDFYKYADLRIDELNRLIIGRFDAAKREIRRKRKDGEADYYAILSKLYQQLDADARYEMYLLLDEQYAAYADEEPDEGFEDLFLERILSSPDEITHYAYTTEVLRKRDRAIEAVRSVSGSRKTQAELDKAMRLWSQQTSQYLDNVAYEVALQAMKDSGVRYVKWVTQNDEKVCAPCLEKDGRIYPIDKLPTRPHWRCRCEIKRIDK